MAKIRKRKLSDIIKSNYETIARLHNDGASNAEILEAITGSHGLTGAEVEALAVCVAGLNSSNETMPIF